MIKIKKRLSNKEKAFCYYLVETGNPTEAFSISGMQTGKENIQELVTDENIREEIKKIYEIKKQNLAIKSEIGYERLAFGEISDPIKLMFVKNYDENQIKNMNLFNISEIKRLKDGTIEIKFFDRMKALEKLYQIQINRSENEVLPFYSALENGIKNLTFKSQNQNQNQSNYES
ncbi:MAG: terminase small subunit [Clostridia bacterium]|nr:terminase small subunit [Clostridia bacterium]